MAIPHQPRRRPLKSKTYDTFLRLLSISCHPSFASPPIKDDKAIQKDPELCSTQSLETSGDSKSVLDDKKEEDCILDEQSSIVLIECEDKKENQRSVDLVVDEGNGSDPVSEGIHKRNDEHCMLEVRSSSFSLGMELKGDEEFSVDEVFEALDCSLNVDAAPKLSTHGQSGEQEHAVEEQNMSVEIMQELQQKEKELEKLIMSSDFVDAAPLAGACEEMEEGELSRDMDADDMSVDMLSDYGILPSVEKAKELEAFKYFSEGEEFARGVGQREIQKNKGHSSSLLDAMTSENDVISEADGKRSRDTNGSFLREISGAKVAKMNFPGHLADESNCMGPSGNMKPENVADNQTSAAAEKGDDAPKKKRTPLTKERREKKKKKEKIKRAEKNRALGVKRLKIRPMVKPKAVSYCRHYIKGRCQEGEKCKFSHDTVPLTKSTACCHFARHSCMKGDDCPFDHQLSKYPCNNYASKGFCSRGADCLFSHEVPAKEARSNPPKTEKREHIHGTTSKKVEAKSGPSGLFNVINNVQHSAAPVKIQSIQPPKGVNVLVHGNMSSAQMHKQPDSQISKTDSGGNKGLPVAHNSQKANEVLNMAAAKPPKGINFLSFGKSTLSGSNGKGVSSLLPNRDFRTEKSALCTPTPNGDGVFVSSGNSFNNRIPGGPLSPRRSGGKSEPTSLREVESTFERSQIPTPSKATFFPFTYKFAVEHEMGIASSSKSSFLTQTSPLANKALHSTLAFAANVEALMKLDSSKTSSVGK